jgi:hypothetical protein
MPAPKQPFLKILRPFPFEISEGQTVSTNHMASGLAGLKCLYAWHINNRHGTMI